MINNNNTSNINQTYIIQAINSSGGTGFDVFVTGGTYSNGTAIFTNNSGGTFSVSGFSTGGSGGTGFDVFVTGGTFKNYELTLTNNTGGTFNVLIPARIFTSGSTTTTNNTLTLIDTISGLTNNSNFFIKSYLTAYKDNIDYGFWGRTLAINNYSGVTIIGENSDFDRISSGLTSSSIIYSGINQTIEIFVSGETSKNYFWKSNWEIIK
jgi:hypothetical protein